MTLQCPECALPYVTTQFILLMATHNVRSVELDGAPIKFTHVTTKTTFIDV